MSTISELPVNESDVSPQPSLEVNPPPQIPSPDPTRYGDWEVAGRCIDF